MLIYPNSYFKSVDKITIDFLRKNKIKALILDVDSTLIDYYKNYSFVKIVDSCDLQDKLF